MKLFTPAETVAIARAAGVTVKTKAALFEAAASGVAAGMLDRISSV